MEEMELRQRQIYELLTDLVSTRDEDTIYHYNGVIYKYRYAQGLPTMFTFFIKFEGEGDNTFWLTEHIKVDTRDKTVLRFCHHDIDRVYAVFKEYILMMQLNKDLRLQNKKHIRKHAKI